LFTALLWIFVRVRKQRAVYGTVPQATQIQPPKLTAQNAEKTNTTISPITTPPLETRGIFFVVLRVRGFR
jgi:hypothetical protein